MKKAVSLILAISLCLSLCACSDSTDDFRGVDLGNYEQYLSVSAGMSEITEAVTVGKYPNIARNIALKFYVNAEGVSTNFNYNSITIKVRFYGQYSTTALVSTSSEADVGSTQRFDFVLELTTNVAGSGTVYKRIDAPYNKAIVQIGYNYEILSVVGCVEPV